MKRTPRWGWITWEGNPAGSGGGWWWWGVWGWGWGWWWWWWEGLGGGGEKRLTRSVNIRNSGNPRRRICPLSILWILQQPIADAERGQESRRSDRWSEETFKSRRNVGEESLREFYEWISGDSVSLAEVRSLRWVVYRQDGPATIAKVKARLII